MISTVTNRGKLRFMLYRETLTAPVLIRFLSRLIRDAQGRKVFLILDNLRVHHSKKVSAWVGDRKEQIELFFLPAYAPELRSEEHTSELQSLMRISYAVFCLKTKQNKTPQYTKRKLN